MYESCLTPSFSQRFVLLFEIFTHTYMHPIYHVGLNITEVAHDYQSTIKTYVEQLGLVNSYDTWHGMVSNFIWCVLIEIMQARRMWLKS